MCKDRISFMGDRNLWIQFVAKVKTERKKVWEVLKISLKKYLKNGK